jgi:hypothetical protein
MLDASNDLERAGIEEQYSSATNTTNLKVEARRRLPVDYVVAAGWSRSRLGAALLRVHSEWDGSEKPIRPTQQAIDALAASYKREDDGLVPWSDKVGGEVVRMKPIAVARRQANQWHLHELGLLFQKLKTLPEVRRELIGWCDRIGIHGGEHKAPAVIGWWLDPTCVECGGLRFQIIPGTARHSDKACEKCKGSGEAHLPYGQDGRKVLGYIVDCLQAARSSMQGRFKHQRGKE